MRNSSIMADYANNDMRNITTQESDNVEVMTEVQLWRNYQIYKNWLKVVGEKLFIEATETDIDNLKFGLRVKNLLKGYTNIPLR